MYAPVLHFKDTINETINLVNDTWKERTRSLISLLIISANILCIAVMYILVLRLACCWCGHLNGITQYNVASSAGVQHKLRNETNSHAIFNS